MRMPLPGVAGHHRRRRPITVALIGPDGAGKTTIARRLEQARPDEVKYLYMGINLEAGRLMLPTTRLMLALKRARGGRRDMTLLRAHEPLAPPSGATLRRLAKGAKDGVRIANWIAEEWLRQLAAWWYGYRGYVVVFDRHFFSDYYAAHIAAGAGRSRSARLHGFVLERLYPRPDLVVYLDAPAQVLFDRKGEGTLAWIEQRRRDYLQMSRLVPAFEVVDASLSLPLVVGEVFDVISRFQRGWAQAS